MEQMDHGVSCSAESRGCAPNTLNKVQTQIVPKGLKLEQFERQNGSGKLPPRYEITVHESVINKCGRMDKFIQGSFEGFKRRLRSGS